VAVSPVAAALLPSAPRRVANRLAALQHVLHLVAAEAEVVEVVEDVPLAVNPLVLLPAAVVYPRVAIAGRLTASRLLFLHLSKLTVAALLVANLVALSLVVPQCAHLGNSWTMGNVARNQNEKRGGQCATL